MLNKLIRNMSEMADFVEQYNLESIGRMRVKALEPSGKKLDFKVLVSENAPSYTDNKRIVVGYSNMYTNLTGKRIAAIGYALEIHELSHVYFSEFDFFKKFIEDVQSDLQNEFKNTEKELHAKNAGASIAKFIYNGIEDGRIEFLVNYKINNAKVLIDGLRSIWWDRQPLQDGTELNHFLFAIVSYATMRLMPKGFYDIYPENHRVYENFEKIENLIKKASRVVSSVDHRDLCYEIYDTSKDYFMELIEEGQVVEQDMDTDYENTSESNDVSDEVSDIIEENKRQGDSKDKSEEESDDENLQNESGEDDSSENVDEDEGEGESESSKDGKTNEELKKESEEKIKRAMDKFEEEEDKLSNSIENNYKKEKKKEEKEYNVDEHLDERKTEMVAEDYRVSGGVVEGIKYFKPAKKDFVKTRPSQKISNEGKKLERLMADILEKRKSFKRVGLDRGRLNTRALWSIPSGNRKVFLRNKKNKPDDTVGYILIDGSGSMFGQKHETATESAAIIEQGMKNLIPLKIAQFTVSYEGVYHKTVKRFEQNTKNVNYVQSLKNTYMKPSYGNADGISIRVAVEELLERNEGEKILTIISDGLPTGYRSDTEALNHVKSTVEYAKKNGITIASIFIGSDNDKRQVENEFKYMYGEACLFTDGSDLNRKLINIFKKKMM